MGWLLGWNFPINSNSFQGGPLHSSATAETRVVSFGCLCAFQQAASSSEPAYSLIQANQLIRIADSGQQLWVARQNWKLRWQSNGWRFRQFFFEEKVDSGLRESSIFPYYQLKNQRTMQAKNSTQRKHRASERHSAADPQLPSFPISLPSRGRQLQTSTPTHPSIRSAPSRSTSRTSKHSRNKLFQKAHETAAGETYLKASRSHPVSQPSPKSRTKDLAQKNSALGVHKELDLKINGGESEAESSFSRLVMQCGCEDGFVNVDLSSIKQDGYQTGSEISFSESFLRDIAAN